jgi:hypothetical protein
VLLVLAEPGDAVAAAVAGRLGGAARWFTPLDLAAGRWTHRPDGATTLRTASERIEFADARGVLNRVRWLPLVGFRSRADREYAAMERQALLTSVLAGLAGPVVNPVRPPSLSGPALTTAGWLALAARCGLPVAAMLATTDGRRWPGSGRDPAGWRAVFEHDVPETGWPAMLPVGRRPVVWAEPVVPAGRAVVVGGSVHGGSGGLAEGCRTLSQASGCPLLEVRLGRADDGRTVVTGADPLPQELPPAAVDALVELVSP